MTGKRHPEDAVIIPLEYSESLSATAGFRYEPGHTSSSVQLKRALERIDFLEGVIARLQAGIKESADIVSVVEVRIYEAWPSGDPEPVVKQTITVPYPLPMSRSRFDALEREGRAGYDPHPWKYARDCA